MKIIDATGSIVGRLAATAAKETIKGGEVAIINIEKAAFTGEPRMVVAKFEARRAVQQKGNPEKSPKWPRRPDMLFRKIVDGMMPKHTSRTKAAFKRLHVYLGTPAELAGKPAEKMEKKVDCKTVTLLQLCRSLGWTAPME